MELLILLCALLAIAGTEEIKCDADNKCPQKYVCYEGTCAYRCPIYEPENIPAGCEVRMYTDRKGCERPKIIC
ncbi:unnamed protein product [Cylicocyclus nassatus]|uniref:Uncharacterized protein n=1 Tax=Cylicocyclus nassatus TaxID=53992 RepID=A0AA36M4I9_CYLNA|nr:unnamed protein product [Cylicocyclus nassatus]